jgi:hypothetical protein
VTVFLGNRKVVEDDKEDEEVVDREALLNKISREKLKGTLLGQRWVIQTGETRIVGKLPAPIGIETGAKQEGQGDPDDHIDESLSMPDGVGLPFMPSQVHKEGPDNEKTEETVKPPEAGKRKKQGMWCHHLFNRGDIG